MTAKPALKIVPKSDRCACAKCKHLGAAIHRRWMEKHHAKWSVPEDFETWFAPRWHTYHDKLTQLDPTLPARVAHQTYGAASPTKRTPALMKLLDFVEDADAPNIAVLAGPVGTGKTFAAVWLAMHRLAEDYSPVFVTAPEFSRLPRYGGARERVFDADALILDDLGRELLDDKFAADFDELVDGVYQSLARLLVITTNCTAEQFRQRYGERVRDRFAEIGTWIPCLGKSLRGAK